MIALDRQGWILVGFGVLFFTALVVSACGWLLLWRSRGAPVAVERTAAPPVEEPTTDETPTDDSPIGAEDTTVLPPANPFR